MLALEENTKCRQAALCGFSIKSKVSSSYPHLLQLPGTSSLLAVLLNLTPLGNTVSKFPPTESNSTEVSVHHQIDPFL